MNANQKTNKLAKEIADEAAICEITSCCPGVTGTSGTWFDSNRADPVARRAVSRAIEYLARREILERHYDFHNYVRAKEPTLPDHRR